MDKSYRQRILAFQRYQQPLCLQKQLLDFIKNKTIDPLIKNKKIIELLKKGVSLTHPDEDGKTAFYYIIITLNSDIVDFIIKEYSKNDVEMMIAESKCFFAHQTVFHWIATYGTALIMQQLLTITSSFIDEPDFKGDNPLHLACFAKKEDIIAVLIGQGADIFKQNALGANPLQMTSIFGLLQSTRLLLETYKAQRFLTLHKNYLKQRHPSTQYTALHYAVTENKLEIAQLLLEHGALVNSQSDILEAPLFLALKNKNSAMVQLLLRYGASVNEYSCHDEIPLYVAVKKRSLKLVKLLVKAQAIVDLPSTEKRITPLFLAVQAHALEIAQFLLNHGANLDESFLGHEKTLAESIKKQANDKQRSVSFLLAYQVKRKIEYQENEEQQTNILRTDHRP